jgi:hypothetical protein
MRAYPYKSEQRLNEARTCLERIRSAKNVYEVKEAFNSFLNATRFGLDPLKTDSQNIEGFKKWWDEKAEFLKNDALCKFFRELRNDIIKSGKDPFGVSQTIQGPTTITGPVQIGPQGILKGIIERGRTVWKPVSLPGVTTSIGLQGVPDQFKDIKLTDLCQKYLDLLSGIVDEFVLNFGTD